MRISVLSSFLFLFPKIKYLANKSYSRIQFTTYSKMIYKFDFEVFGKVQGVFFRKYTKLEADMLNIKGYVQNTNKNTVIGTAESENKESLNRFRNFLTNKGSPSSRIDKCLITDEKTIDVYSTNSFYIKR
ncbi:acylphosphatase, putative [Plasmodium berghei]|uniref:acylphosphatase n=2 Tax=Plasmodium berghei TaxID=5821 RepID=A0A509AK42_PLABA|nr:acylphosphatase, putative [Plasmodium berghei ANKA]CXI45471.1 acylphosphatase, putative [Plasmodium berghei]SCM22677.1 acylphosphatase, putative [Plasmodium berghei]SCN25593.1 acylphosphatase, putative [Plasmodium berghei]SCO60537.1 acylphosphatase, putative [Plasmodium berghei]SCO62296.1 acylphosphatase, putative [Plasmodium berghei]|eukprot:XP_034421712.1 acylphosphatase, putative [Plasmodium berghei ANKA]